VLLSLPGLPTVLLALVFAAALVVIFVAGVQLDVRAERRRRSTRDPGRYSSARSSFRAAELMQ